MTTPTAVDYEVVIGVEVHAQLLTRSKMFCSCPADYFGAPPNSHVCPVCLGMPGVLPVINRRAVELTIMTGLALNCQVPPLARFDRKNYPYPDLMKGYQISQYDQPLCRDGWLEIEVEGQRKRVRINRVHLEEDTARLVHVTTPEGESYSLVDVNRSGVPLMEIVSEPDLRSAEEARAYLVKLRQVLRWIGASRANMEEGDMRCEANVSVRPRGAEALGAKVELKNINSFKHVYEAIRYEVQRQIRVLESGGRVAQETRGWREDLGQTVPQRSKEFAHDYRYFPEPDLPPLVVSPDWVEEIRRRMPELPDARRRRLQAEYGLSDYDARLLTESRAKADLFEGALAALPVEARAARAKAAANWVNSELAGLLHSRDLEWEDCPLTPASLAELLALLEEGTINTSTAKAVLEECLDTGRSPRRIVEEKGLAQISAGDELVAIVEGVLASNPKAVADYRAGKEGAIQFLVGQVMRQTRGRANPEAVRQMLKERLSRA
ncbi:MAG TPA: Asp-tRNA(Asn)/Glu-tRNA(Gln) amidotransferase subunit GatB [Dehalococcoidia bacterium]|nr:Asp-tRNA(Asn)/Glu-tRNA(Gln) amidotransferase subunit GatB [Dehalococcoidia bacterium]